MLDVIEVFDGDKFLVRFFVDVGVIWCGDFFGVVFDFVYVVVYECGVVWSFCVGVLVVGCGCCFIVVVVECGICS